MTRLVFIDNEGITDPHINLAIEEYALRYFDPAYTYLLFYVNEPSIIIGRNQNTIEEINREYVKEKGIHVVRRLSGGGAVYHDTGNLNFSFITDHGADRLHNFKLFTGPVVEVLREMGVEAEVGGRNDVVIDNQKISGNAQYSTSRRMFSHGTLLFNSDLDEVQRALNVKTAKFQSKGHQSVKARVANIAEYAEREMNVPTFRERLLHGIFHGTDVPIYRLTAADWQGIRQLYDKRYSRWEWNVGESPPFEIQRSRRFPIGEIDLRLEVRKGLIKEIKIFGDFLGTRSTHDLENLLRGQRYDPEILQDLLSGVDLSAYFGMGADKGFIELLYGEELETVR